MQTNYVGIDYGRGLVNIDTETNIRYGVINQNEVLQAWADSSEADYGDVDSEELDDFAEPIGYTLDDGEYKAYAGDDGDIFIISSPYYTRAQFCSPCAPGAVYLTNPTPDGERGYCFGHDWFDEGRAPYPVFRVSDDSEVLPDAN